MSDVPLPIGTYEDALAMVGHQADIVFTEVPVEWGIIRTFASLLEDGNPSYWDPATATALWGSIIAPPGLLKPLFFPTPWTPAGLPVRADLGRRVPLPGRTLINASTEITFERPIRLGEQLNMIESVTSVSPERRTRLGPGHFVTTTAVIRGSAGDLVATAVYTLLRFEPETAEVSA